LPLDSNDPRKILCEKAANRNHVVIPRKMRK
jgi:hypothetical protein